MYGDTKKIHLIEAILKIENETELAEVESAINRSTMPTESGKSFKSFAGIWTVEEANSFEKIIEESCGQINPNDWQ